MSKKDALKITGVVIIVIGILFIWVCALTGGYVYNSSIHAVDQERRSLDVKKASLIEAGFDVDQLETKYKVKQVEIESSFGRHKIPANYLIVDNRRRNTVIMAHGLNGNRLTGYPVAKMFLEHGYNVLAYDQRDSGKNQAGYMTCGYWESNDFKDCVTYVRGIVGPGKKVGAWGSSIGGSTIGIYLGTEHAERDLDFAVLDCPVSNMRDTVGTLVRKKITFLPMAFKLDLGDMITRLNLGFSYEEGNPCNYVKKTTVPVLIFNSKVDKVTPYYMGADLYKAMKKNKKEILTVKDSRHTDIYFDHPKLYEKTMIEFMKKCVL